MAILMFSLIGLPPLAGFFAKWQVFLAAIQAQLYVLAVIGVLASAVSAYLLSAHRQGSCISTSRRQQFAAVPGELRFIMALSGFLVVTYFLTVGAPLAALAHVAAGSLF